MQSFMECSLAVPLVRLQRVAIGRCLALRAPDAIFRPVMRRHGAFVVSLDFELHWGVRDLVPLNECQQRLLGVREAIPAMLRTFEDRGIHATWAAVGMLFARGRDDLRA